MRFSKKDIPVALMVFTFGGFMISKLNDFLLETQFCQEQLHRQYNECVNVMWYGSWYDIVVSTIGFGFLLMIFLFYNVIPKSDNKNQKLGNVV